MMPNAKSQENFSIFWPLHLENIWSIKGKKNEEKKTKKLFGGKIFFWGRIKRKIEERLLIPDGSEKYIANFAQQNWMPSNIDINDEDVSRFISNDEARNLVSGATSRHLVPSANSVGGLQMTSSHKRSSKVLWQINISQLRGEISW